MKTNQSWGGRFAEGPSESVARYTDSQSYDRALYAHDIKASQAHARMLGRQGIISHEEAMHLVSGLEQVREEIASGAFVWKPELEDVHMNIEARLTEIIGPTGKKLHTGRSRNDQVGLSFRLFVADRMTVWQDRARELCRVLLRRAEEHAHTILPGCTHLQPAQPVSLGHHLLAYAWMFRRDCQRMEDALKRTRTSPLGAAALAGTTYALDPLSVAKDVGFEHICGNSLDAVSDRDFVLEALFCASTAMMHLSRLCEEIILWANPAFGFVRLPDAYATGSSIMPQKKNPDICELVRGKTGRVYGHLVALLTVMKGLPLAYDKDMQEDKEGVFDTIDTLRFALDIYAGMLSTMTVNGARTRAVLENDFSNATDMADYLAKKGLPFRRAHAVVGNAVAYCIENRKVLLALTMEEFKKMSPLFETDIYEVLQIENCVKNRDSYGGTGPEQVKRQQREAKKIVSRQKKLAAEWKEANAFIE